MSRLKRQIAREASLLDRASRDSIEDAGHAGQTTLVSRNPSPEPGLYGVSFTYPDGDVQALNKLTLPIPTRRSIGVIGPSGCGKSTLLTLLAGLVEPDEGSIISPVIEGRRELKTMVFQRDTLLPWLTVASNIKLYYKFHRAEKREVDARVTELIKLGKLDTFENSYPHQLSGGMRKRVAFLCAVAPSPTTLLLDEPFSSLDEPTRVALHQDVLRITKQFGMTVVLVTHDLAEAISLCDEVAILTNRPARVASRHQIPFGPDRNLTTIRQEPDYQRVYAALWKELNEQIAAGSREKQS